MTLRLGVIGLSEGNGHPYSWSAICNGYDPEAMADCGFPVIPEYLAARRWPDDRLPGVSVTLAWTQDTERTRHLARASCIEGIVDRPEEMIGLVDAVLLARDDAEHHHIFAKPFLEAGVPIYIDKPIALDRSGLDALYDVARAPETIFSCSALRFAPELAFDDALRARIGPPRRVAVRTPKDWDRYAVHVIEPLLALPGTEGAIRGLARSQTRDGARFVAVAFEGGVEASITTLGTGTRGAIEIDIHGEHDWVRLTFVDAFTAFRSALAVFARGVERGRSEVPRAHHERVVQIIEYGRAA